MQLNSAEQSCVRMLAKLFSDGTTRVTDDEGIAALKAAGLDVNAESYLVLMRTMEHCGAIDNVQHLLKRKFARIRPTARAVEIARELDALAEPGDIVEKVTQSARRHPVWAWVILGILVLTAIVTLINQTLQVLERAGVLGAVHK